MATTRIARIIATAAAVPLALGVLGGVAHASSAPPVDFDINATAQGLLGSGVFGPNKGNNSTTQQAATGPGASNKSNTANVNGSGFTVINQQNDDLWADLFSTWTW